MMKNILEAILTAIVVVIIISIIVTMVSGCTVYSRDDQLHFTQRMVYDDMVCEVDLFGDRKGAIDLGDPTELDIKYGSNDEEVTQ